MRRALPAIFFGAGLALGWLGVQNGSSLFHGDKTESENVRKHSLSGSPKTRDGVEAGDVEPAPSSPSSLEELLTGLEGVMRYALMAPLAERLDAIEEPEVMETLFREIAAHPETLDVLLVGHDWTRISRSTLVREMMARRWAQLDRKAAFAFGSEHNSPVLMVEAVRAFAEEEPDALGGLLARIPTEQFRNEALRLSFDSLAPGRPELMITLTGQWAPSYLDRAYGAWARLDPRSAAAHAGEHVTANASDRYRVLEAITQNWAAEDPEAALAWARTFEESRHRKSMESLVMQAFAHRDPQRAISLALESGEHKSMTKVAEILAGRHPERALGWIRSIENEASRSAMMLGVAGAASRGGNVDLLLEATKGLPESPQVSGEINTWVMQLINADLEKAIDWLKREDDREVHQYARDHVLSVWTARDPEASVSYLREHPEMLARSQSAHHLIGQLASSDPEFAIEQAFDLDDPAKRYNAIGSAVDGWVGRDREAVTAFGLELEDDGLKAQTFRKIHADLAQDPPSEVTRWLESLPVDAQAAQRAALAGVIGQRDPMRAFAMLQPLLEMETDQPLPDPVQKALDSTIGGWAGQQPEAVARWALEQPLAEVQENAIRSSVRVWSGRDYESAEQFVHSLRETPHYDHGAAALADAVRRYRPAEAFDWAATIGEAGESSRVMRSVIEEWADVDLPAALDALNSPALTGGDREGLRKLFLDRGLLLE